mgnify:CR=1 FL=1
MRRTESIAKSNGLESRRCDDLKGFVALLGHLAFLSLKKKKKKNETSEQRKKKKKNPHVTNTVRFILVLLYRMKLRR